ncbi:MAG: FecR domain-containing protein [Bacteroidales bacterium]|nr:FecR domain-containing protein [Bacteroidales bacterium]
MAINQKLLQDYFDGALSGEDNLRVQQFLAENWDNPELVTLMDSQFDACRIEPSAHDRKMLREVRKNIQNSSPRYRVWMAAAAIIAFLLAIPATMQLGYRMHREAAPVEWQELTVSNTETAALDLPDGTHLVLNAGSRITWPSRFTGDSREVFLEGEVLAQVAKDPEHPFIIHSGDVNVKVYGTTFEFKSFRNETQVQLTLMEGAVSLDVPSSEGNREISLSPGDMALYDREAGDVSLTKVSVKRFPDVRSFSFYNTPLRDIVAELERNFGRRIVIGDAKIADKRFLAFFTNGESLDEILSLLAKNGKLRISPSEEGYYIYGR